MRIHKQPATESLPGIRSGGLKKAQGFTLIELSIVLVIIGLIVGGVLVGQDLIRAAEIRATVGQIEKYNSAVNTFTVKYNGMPGDLSSSNALGYGFLLRMGSSPGGGDNNGLIEAGNINGVTSQVFTFESGVFWDDLSRANLVDGQLTFAGDGVAIAAAAVPAQFPEARIARGNRVHVGSTGGLNYYLITGITSVAASTGVITTTANLTPTELYNMDNKLDDGIPLTGIVQARYCHGGVYCHQFHTMQRATRRLYSQRAGLPGGGGERAGPGIPPHRHGGDVRQ
jgi:prepilin-type N-terminal cleavage/methylation domain-containing protein